MAPDIPIRVSDEVRGALAAGRPVVALETTILSFGLPQPDNLRVARECEQIVRQNGAVPATMALLDGHVCAGLSDSEITFFCSQDPTIKKVNPQNFATSLARRAPGALTVAASLMAASMAGLRVFATGGIGGVHRGFDMLPDVSADLPALSRYPIAVVCAGAKSILDIPATLEVLETLGVPVLGYRTCTFPVFFCPESEHELDVSAQDMATLVPLVRMQLALNQGAALVVTPLPAEVAVSSSQLEIWVDTALKDAREMAIDGKRLTPFLLDRMKDLSDGATLRANRGLIHNNVRVAAELACSLAGR